MVEHQLPKLRVAGSSPVIRSIFYLADVAQLVEQRTRNAQVAGSNPVVGSNDFPLIYQHLNKILNTEKTMLKLVPKELVPNLKAPPFEARGVSCLK